MDYKMVNSGLDYFPMNVDFLHDEKIEFISYKFKEAGEAITLRLLCRIYRNGYFILWDDDQAFLFANRMSDDITKEFVNDVIKELIDRNFFSKELFDSYNVLTSAGIQRRYFQATHRRKNVEAIQEYLLIDVSGFDVQKHHLNNDDSSYQNE